MSAPDPNIAQRAASAPASSVWVGASAGTGKTKVLTDRVLRLMLAGTRPERILCITFTRAAAAEMSERIAGRLSAWAVMEEGELVEQLTRLEDRPPAPELVAAARRLFARVVDTPGGLRILTIHAFCQSLLRRFPLEAGVPPHFEVLDERSAGELMVEARNKVLRDARHGPEGALGQALDHVTGQVGQEDFNALMGALARERGRLTRLLEQHGGLDGVLAALARTLGIGRDDTPDRVLAAGLADAALDGQGLRAAARCLVDKGTEKTDQPRGRALLALLEMTVSARAAAFEDWQAVFLTDAGLPRKSMATKAAAEALPALEAEQDRVLALVERHRKAQVAASTAALLTIAVAWLDGYAARKAARALFDYDDLIYRALALLRESQVAAWVLFKLDGGLDHILVDEAQDTNPDQWALIRALADEFFTGLTARDDVVRTIFAVGDEKQSIFSFQRADPAEFARARDHFSEKVYTTRNLWQDVALNVSFRSTEAVLKLVDGLFADDDARAGVVMDAEEAIGHAAHRQGHAGQVDVWPLLATDETPDPPDWCPDYARGAGQPSARMARLIAVEIGRWIKTGEMLPARGRPIHAGDIMVLVRKRGVFVEQLVSALKSAGIPVAGVDRMVLTEQLSVMDLMALGRFLLLPEDDLTLAVVLRSPFIDLDEEALFELCHDRPDHLWPRLQAMARRDPRFGPAAAWLGALLEGVDLERPHELFAGILSLPCPGDGRSGLRALLGRLGADALDPVEEFLNACLTHERSHVPSLQGFLHWLEAGEAEIKREQGEGGEARVRIMTVHGAKGLQAPVVIMPDTVSMADDRELRILWPDREDEGGVPLWAMRRAVEDGVCTGRRAAARQRQDEEYRRLLYVALTRAEDRLIVAGFTSPRRKPRDGSWYEYVLRAMARLGQPAPPPAGLAGKAWRLAQAQEAEPVSEPAPGLMAAQVSGLPDWALRPAPEEPDPPRPLTPSRPAEAEPPARSPLEPDMSWRFGRGLLVHRLLQVLPELPAGERRGAAAAFLARPGAGLEPAVQSQLLAEVMAVLDDPVFAPIFGPGSQAEAAVAGLVAGRVLAGQIDRLLVTDDAVLIADFKTNRPPPRVLEDVSPAYLRQMAAYRAAARAIWPGRAVRCGLVFTDGPRLMELPDAALDPHDPAA